MQDLRSSEVDTDDKVAAFDLLEGAAHDARRDVVILQTSSDI